MMCLTCQIRFASVCLRSVAQLLALCWILLPEMQWNLINNSLFMYRRRLLCTLYGPVDFLNVLKKGCWGGGDVLVVLNEIHYVPLGEGGKK
jgi:hypothetical protein